MKGGVWCGCVAGVQMMRLLYALKPQAVGASAQLSGGALVDVSVKTNVKEPCCRGEAAPESPTGEQESVTPR